MSRLDPDQSSSNQSASEDQSKLIGQLREQIATLSVQNAQSRPDSGSSQDNSKIKEVKFLPKIPVNFTPFSAGIGVGKDPKRKRGIVQSDHFIGIKISFTDI